MSEYTADKVYEEAYKNSPKWDKWLPKDVYDYHHLMMKEVNAPVDLQMGVLLPFISSLCGPKTRTLYLPTESVLNIFWINIAASGVGKTVCRKRFISASLDYILKNFPGKISDFEVSKFTRAGEYIIL